MSVALIDIGNSRMKWGVMSGPRVVQKGALRHDQAARNRFDAVFAALPENLAQVMGCNVADPRLARDFEAAARQRFGIDCEWASVAAQMNGLINGYEHPEQLGVDRWVALYAAYAAGQFPTLIVDAGTACTIDGLGADGRHCGGLIVPGLEMMQGELFGRTSDIAGKAAAGGARTAIKSNFGRSTAAAVELGCLSALAGAVEKAHAAWLETQPHAALIITGGDAPAIVARLDIACDHRPALVLEGLAYMVKGGNES